MNSRLTMAIGLVVMVVTTGPLMAQGLKDCPPPPPGFPKFKVQEIASDFKIGYAVHICDVNGDSKPDIVVVDKERVVWYENPTWKMRTILQGKTKPDNVCICSLDIDGDGKIDFVLGAGWKPGDTKTAGTLQWLRRTTTLDEEWEMFEIPCEEPTIHRVKVADLYGKGTQQIVVAPLLGRNATAARNWMDGRPVKVLAFEIPINPISADEWSSTTISENLHVIHNFTTKPNPKAHDLWYASYEGLTHSSFRGNGFQFELVNEANQANPKGNRGASEVAGCRNGPLAMATIEPWHGNQVVVYPALKKRIVIDEQLRWGHAIQWSDLLDEKRDMIIAGVRDNPDPKQGDKFTEKRGVRIYRATDAQGEKWERYILEDGGVAVEDLAVADLNGDGKPDIIAVGRATQNCRIYWNQGK